MTPRMKQFLEYAADVETGKGVPIRKFDRQIASMAVNAGHGMILSSIFSVFIINDAGRAAITKATT